MADRDEMRDEMTSGEAGETLTLFAERWPGALVEREGRDCRRREEPSRRSIVSVDDG